MIIDRWGVNGIGATSGRNRGKRYGGPWYGDERRVVLFEASARARYPGLNRQRSRGGRVYTLTLPVADYGSRTVTITFEGRVPVVRVDGPTQSPHRYDETRLCLWHPTDPAAQRWVLEDGLDELIGIIAGHLFREAWWREWGEWLGPEAPHAPKRIEDEES